MKTTTRHRGLWSFAVLRKAAASCSCLLFFVVCLHAQRITSRENQVKAVFLFNFTQFVEWPASAFGSPNAPFIIGVIGNDPFGNYLDETVAGEKVMNHPLVVQRYKDLSDLQACHMLFIGQEDPQKVKAILDVLDRRHTLTVSDYKNFAYSGGMIRFFTQENKTRLQINLSIAKAAELNISSKLLRVAEIID